MTFKEFLQLEGSEKSGNRNPSPQRRVLPGLGLTRKAVMPSRAVPDHDPIRFIPKKKRLAGNNVGLVPQPDNIVPGTIKRPSDRLS